MKTVSSQIALFAVLTTFIGLVAGGAHADTRSPVQMQFEISDQDLATKSAREALIEKVSDRARSLCTVQKAIGSGTVYDHQCRAELIRKAKEQIELAASPVRLASATSVETPIAGAN